MKSDHVGDVVVIDDATDQRIPIGIVTDRDIALCVADERRHLDDLKVSDVMSSSVVTSPEHQSLYDAVKRMQSHGVRRLPIVNADGGLEGILTFDAIIDLLSEELADLAARGATPAAFDRRCIPAPRRSRCDAGITPRTASETGARTRPRTGTGAAASVNAMPCGTPVTLFLCGDVMTGRGIDQILAHPNRPGIQEPYVRDARDYVALAEEVNGPIPRPVESEYIWGDALQELERVRPDVRVINLETSVTSCDEFWPGKGIHYRMHPANIGCLTAARLDICTLGNNHVLDYSYGGLEETLDTLMAAGITVTGAGRTLEDARRPAMVDLENARRLLVFSIGFESSGIPSAWAADTDRPGVDWLPNLSEQTADEFLERVRRVKRAGDIAVASVHWGSNWGYDIPPSQIRFAHRLLDGAVDLVHGHSSHHPRPIEIYRDKLVLYGCGDFLNDYEGISGYEQFRDDLVLMYFPRIDPGTGHLLTLSMAPMRIRQLRLVHASAEETAWLRDRLGLICRKCGSDVDLTGDGKLMLHQLVALRA